MDYFELKKIIYHAKHGVTEQERIVGNNYSVDIKIYFSLNKAIESDDLNDTINYAGIFSLIKEEMSIPSNLIEHVAGRIVKKIIKTYPNISKVKIRLAKINPPVEGEIQEAAVVISYSNRV